MACSRESFIFYFLKNVKFQNLTSAFQNLLHADFRSRVKLTGTALEICVTVAKGKQLENMFINNQQILQSRGCISF